MRALVYARVSAVPGNLTAMLTVREPQALTIAATRYSTGGGKATAARELVGYTEPTFHLIVDQLLDRPDALAERPDVVPRLRRLRDARAAARSRAS